MKPSLQALKTNANESVATYWVRSHAFGFHWHYHPEIELCYVHKGAGTRMIGDSVREFSEGDLVLVGSNLPHTWISQHYANASIDNMQVFVVQFLPELFTETLLHLPEFTHVATLLKAISQGIFFENALPVKEKLLQLDIGNSVDKLLKLIEILNLLSVEKTIEPLTSKNYSPFLTQENAKRMQDIFSHIHLHFSEKISLNQIADIACMNESSFCRYFKQNTGQTLTDYINDLRISKACQLLIETKESITEIAQKVGFNSFTNFNKSFVFRKNISPRGFRKSVRVTTN